jgi:hypothetical protein
MSDTKPILVPGQPGDLMGILENALATAQDVKRADLGGGIPAEVTKGRLEGVAVTTMEALAMWMGVAEVAEMPASGENYIKRDPKGLDS